MSVSERYPWEQTQAYSGISGTLPVSKDGNSPSPAGTTHSRTEVLTTVVPEPQGGGGKSPADPDHLCTDLAHHSFIYSSGKK